MDHGILGLPSFGQEILWWSLSGPRTTSYQAKNGHDPYPGCPTELGWQEVAGMRTRVDAAMLVVLVVGVGGCQGSRTNCGAVVLWCQSTRPISLGRTYCGLQVPLQNARAWARAARGAWRLGPSTLTRYSWVHSREGSTDVSNSTSLHRHCGWPRRRRPDTHAHTPPAIRLCTTCHIHSLALT